MCGDMIYLLGVDHQIQHDGGSMVLGRRQAIYAFSNFIEAKAKELRITLFAEELSEDVLEMWRARKATVRSIAIHLGLRHLYCDPTRHQRRELGIHKDRDLREEYWLTCLNDYLYTEIILFVCGADHLDTFHDKLTRKQLQVLILPERFGIGLPLLSISLHDEEIIEEHKQ